MSKRTEWMEGLLFAESLFQTGGLKEVVAYRVTQLSDLDFEFAMGMMAYEFHASQQ